MSNAKREHSAIDLTQKRARGRIQRDRGEEELGRKLDQRAHRGDLPWDALTRSVIPLR